MVETLESRTLLSVSPFGAAVLEDRLQIHVDLQTFKSDCAASFALLQKDVAAVKGDHLQQATTVVPLVTKLKLDVAHARATLLSDRLKEASAVVADEKAIVADLLKALADKGDATAEAADQAKLLADRIKVQTDMVAGLTARINDREAALATISADGQAALTAAQSDPNASPKLVTDLQKWVTDKTTCMTTLTADLTKLSADRQQLVTDLTAEQAA